MNIGIWNPRVGCADAGGTETFLREMIRRLATDHDVTVYTHVDDPPDALADATVVDIPMTRKESRWNRAVTAVSPVIPAEVESLSMYVNARRRGLFDDMDHDVLSTHYYLDNLLVSRAAPCPTLFRFAGIKYPSPRWRAMLRFDDTDWYLANSESTAGRLRRWFQFDTDGAVYAGVDTNAFEPDVVADGGGKRNEILYVGRLDEGKGLTHLLEAHERLDGEHLRLVGDGRLRDELEARAGDGVTFEGRVHHDEIPRYYQSADVLALPSVHEGFPVVVIEALAAGLPVVATDLDAIQETVDDGVHGRLVNYGSVDNLTAALREVLGDDSYAHRAANGGPGIAEQYDWDVQAGVLESHYQRAAEVS